MGANVLGRRVEHRQRIARSGGLTSIWALFGERLRSLRTLIGFLHVPMEMELSGLHVLGSRVNVMATRPLQALLARRANDGRDGFPTTWQQAQPSAVTNAPDPLSTGTSGHRLICPRRLLSTTTNLSHIRWAMHDCSRSNKLLPHPRTANDDSVVG